MPYKKRTFRQALIKLTMTASLCGMLLLGITLLVMFLFSFSGNAVRDMEYYLNNINKQLEEKIRNLEDAVTSVRHDAVLQDFFRENGYRKEKISTQLSYNANLFSEQNKVGDEEPLAVRMYIFNEKGQYARSYYYPYTESHMEELDGKYRTLREEFGRQEEEFYYQVWDDVINLCFHLYDENMGRMGNCIIAVSRKALDGLFLDLEQYRDCVWLVAGSGGAVLAANESGGLAGEFLRLTPESGGLARINGSPHMYHVVDCGFGLRALTAVKSSTIYASVKSSILLFLVTIVLLLAVIGVAVFFMAYRFTRPLGTMARNISTFGRGELDTRLESFDLQEFDDISVTFNEMAERIHYLITQVYEKQLLATQAQVHYLQSQINPHFMFNILSMIAMKAKLGGNDEAYSLLSAFSRLLQGKIFRKGSVMIPLAEEMELVEFYLYLQSSRFRDRIDYEILYEDDDLKLVPIPRLCIEPLVENAVCHGLEPKEGTGKILVDVRRREDRLVIRVEDDGVGFDTERIGDTDAGGHTHVSLINTRKLLQVLYGEDFGMDIESRRGEGTCITVTLPLQGPAEAGEASDTEAGEATDAEAGEASDAEAGEATDAETGVESDVERQEEKLL